MFIEGSFIKAKKVLFWQMSEGALNHVMYVDDAADMRMLVQIALENVGGIRVTLCDSGFDVVKSALSSSPQMIMLDVMMEDMDGPAVLRQLKAHPELSRTPVIFLTGKTGVDNLKALTDMGAIGVISKPFDLATLSDQVKSLWDARHE